MKPVHDAERCRAMLSGGEGTAFILGERLVLLEFFSMHSETEPIDIAKVHDPNCPAWRSFARDTLDALPIAMAIDGRASYDSKAYVADVCIALRKRLGLPRNPRLDTFASGAGPV